MICFFQEKPLQWVAWLLDQVWHRSGDLENWSGVTFQFKPDSCGTFSYSK